MAQSPKVKRAPQQLSGWRASINDYVRLVNQAEIEHAVLPLQEAAGDKDHLQRLDKRLTRTAARDKKRQAASVKHESKARLVRVHELGNETAVLLRCDHTRTLNQQGSVYLEERRDFERIWLQNHNGDCRLPVLSLLLPSGARDTAHPSSYRNRMNRRINTVWRSQPCFHT